MNELIKVVIINEIYRSVPFSGACAAQNVANS